MRNLFAVLSIFLSVFFYSQGSSNPFSGEESHNKESPAYNSDEAVDNGFEGNDNNTDTYNRDPNPGDPVPVDQYAGLLLVTAIGIIIYTTHKKRKLLTQK